MLRGVEITTRWLCCSVLLAFALFGQGQPQIREWTPLPGDKILEPKTSCSALRSFTGYELSILTAVLQQPKGGMPPFCHVVGQILPEIQFEVSLPSSWNQRLYMFGNGGYAGEKLDTPFRVERRDEALKAGFAVAQTNTGHDAEREPGASFAIDSQKLFDYAFRAVHVTVDTAKRLAAAYYGRPAKRSYFWGCSTGGRQALIAAQRFPLDFDGIISGAPNLDMIGTRLEFVKNARALAANPIPVAKLPALAERIYRHCDAKDGVEDGLIGDPRQCDFDLRKQVPICAGVDRPDCFTEGQIQSLEIIYSDIKLNGKSVFPGRPFGAEIGGLYFLCPQGRCRTGWEPWIVREGMAPVDNLTVLSFFRYMAYPEKNPSYELEQFDFARDPARLEWIGQIVNAKDLDLSAFRNRGGKLLMYFGWADASLNPMAAIAYYDAVTKEMGPQTRDFFRLYMLPGVFHCQGGIGCASFDPLTPLIAWVELGRIPKALLGARVLDGKITRTRPHCPYPQIARYKGSGSLDEAGNFVCADPQ